MSGDIHAVSTFGENRGMHIMRTQEAEQGVGIVSGRPSHVDCVVHDDHYKSTSPEEVTYVEHT